MQNFGGKEPLGRLKRGLEDNIMMNDRQIGCEEWL
jgi:hypothetical protein